MYSYFVLTEMRLRILSHLFFLFNLAGVCVGCYVVWITVYLCTFFIPEHEKMRYIRIRMYIEWHMDVHNLQGVFAHNICSKKRM